MNDQQTQLSRKEREEAFRRDLVLDVAERLFAEKGFDGTTVADIAERSELAKGSLYHLFQSKDDIIAALIHRKMGQIIGQLEQALGAPVSPREKIRRIFQLKLRTVWESRHFARIFLHELRGFHWRMDYPLLETYRNEMEEARRRIEMALAEGQKAGEFRDDLPASTLLAAMEGFSNAIIYFWLKSDEEFDLDKAVSQAEALFLNGVSPREGGERQ